MRLEVLRYDSGADETLGLLLEVFPGNAREFLCYTLEDEFRSRKVFGETRIPSGTYEIDLRRVGGHHARYSRKFQSIHDGMLWVRNVPNFKYVLIHIGNTDDDTAGCLLLGSRVTNKRTLANSTKAYTRVYQRVLSKIHAGESVHIDYVDYDSQIRMCQ